MSVKPVQILLVDDDPRISSLLTRIFSYAGKSHWKVMQVERLQDAFGVCGQFQQVTQPVFDVILLEIGLNQACELTLIKTLRHRIPNIPVIVLTYLTDPTIVAQTKAYGACAHLIKLDTSIRQLVHAIDAALLPSMQPC